MFFIFNPQGSLISRFDYDPIAQMRKRRPLGGDTIVTNQVLDLRLKSTSFNNWKYCYAEGLKMRWD